MNHRLIYSPEHLGAICEVCGEFIAECRPYLLPPVPDGGCSGTEMLFLGSDLKLRKRDGTVVE